MLFRFTRPDATRVWLDPIVYTRLNRYRKIIDGDKIARYLIAKKIPVEKQLNELSLEEAWDEHKNARMLFLELLTSLDDGKTDFSELETPKYSFLDLKIWLASEIFKNCEFCERKCGANRAKGETGKCGVGEYPAVSSAFLHWGEEAPLVPSGTIFFAGCTFKCVFCQNYSISQTWKKSRHEWRELTSRDIATMAKSLFDDGALNINYVGGDPVPDLKFVLESLKISEINVTQLWNSNFYMSERAMELLVDVMDFWLPDFKYWNDMTAETFSHIKNYREVTKRNLKSCFEKGSGEMIVRHLVMPGMVETDSYSILEWCAKNIPLAFINIMGQYHPDYVVSSTRHPEINRRVTREEMEKAFTKARELGIEYKQVS
ncbi:MAG: radical SAM protein [Candidatus Hodarchaeales archaeon]|jgi:putative pyruvate formate lyase activating enzyme